MCIPVQRSTLGLLLLLASFAKAQLPSRCRPASVAPCREVDHRVTEIPSGQIDGTNLTFTLSTNMNDQSDLHLYINGLDLTSSAGLQVSGNKVTLANGLAPKRGDLVKASYRLAAERSFQVAPSAVSLSSAHQDALIRAILLQSIGNPPLESQAAYSTSDLPISSLSPIPENSRSEKHSQHPKRNVDADFATLNSRISDHPRKVRAGGTKHSESLIGEDTASDGLGDVPLPSPYTALLEGRRSVATPFSDQSKAERSLGGQQTPRSIKMLEERLSTPDHN